MDEGFLNMDDRVSDFSLSACTDTFKPNYHAAVAKCSGRGRDWDRDLCLVDVRAGRGHEKSTCRRVSPCITKARPNGYFINLCRRHFTLAEMGRLRRAELVAV